MKEVGLRSFSDVNVRGLFEAGHGLIKVGSQQSMDSVKIQVKTIKLECIGRRTGETMGRRLRMEELGSKSRCVAIRARSSPGDFYY